MMTKKVLAVITGQIRNASEHVINWQKEIFSDFDTHYLFYVWDCVGNVDPNKLHLRTLRQKKIHWKQHTQTSKSNAYLIKKTTINDEVIKIKEQLGDKCTFIIVPYKDEYLYTAGGLTINDELKTDSHPWWQGSIPVAYINKLALDYIKDSGKVAKYDYFARLQSEVMFEKVVLNPQKNIENPNILITSPDTIDKNIQVSIKFFMSKFPNFALLMNAHESLVDEYHYYKKGAHQKDMPIGERYLKKLTIVHDVVVQYSVPTKVVRQQVIPIDPEFVASNTVAKNWKLPLLIPIESKHFDYLLSIK
jgi:hypothetical protein